MFSSSAYCKILQYNNNITNLLQFTESATITILTNSNLASVINSE